MKNNYTKLLKIFLISIFYFVIDMVVAYAHGEKAMEPYFRTRTVMFYDVTWSSDNVKVGENVTIEGKFRLHSDWPQAVDDPDVIYVNQSIPGPVFAKIESYLNGVPARQSFRDMEVGKDYHYKMVLQGRVPGNHHVHPGIAIKGSGTIIGPGQFIKVSGSQKDFKFPVTTMDGVLIEDLETYALADVFKWHSTLAILGIFWLLWWVWRPLLIPRYQALKQGREDLLITRLDLTVGILLGVFVFVAIVYNYNAQANKYPITVPLQTSRMYTDPLPVADPQIKINVSRAEYDIPGRTMRMWVEVKNNGDNKVRLGELTTANLRFINKSFGHAINNVTANYPSEHMADGGLEIDKDKYINPGESHKMFITAQDARWETERLTAFLTDVDARVGALLFFYDEEGNRKILDVASSILPVFTDDDGSGPSYQRIGR